MNAGHHPVGITFLATALGAAIMCVLLIATGRKLPFTRRHLIFYVICGLTGTALPNALSYTAMQELQVGIVSIVIAVVPLMTLLASLMIGLERPEPIRLAGLALGAVAVLLLVVPEASLPSPDQAIWIALPVLTSVSYTIENVYIARAKPAELDPMQTMAGLFFAALVLLAPVTAATGTWMAVGRLDWAEISLILMTFAHVGGLFRLCLADRDIRPRVRRSGRLHRHADGCRAGYGRVRRNPFRLGLAVAGPDDGRSGAGSTAKGGLDGRHCRRHIVHAQIPGG